jgi:hypothetical protein
LRIIILKCIVGAIKLVWTREGMDGKNEYFNPATTLGRTNKRVDLTT